jgi:hypothetical protein
LLLFFFFFLLPRASSPWDPWETWIHPFNSEKANCKCRAMELHHSCIAWVGPWWAQKRICKQNKWRLWLFLPTHASYYLAATPPHYSAGPFVSQQKKGDTAGNSVL